MKSPIFSPQRGGKAQPTPQAIAQAQARQRAQSWLPLKDLHDGFLIRPDGGVIAGIKIAPFNLALKSERERQGIIQSFQAALNGLTVPWQLLSLERPVDLDAYLDSLDRVDVPNGPQKRILRDYAGWVRAQAQSGNQVERRYYLLMTRQGKDAQAEHRTALRGLGDDLARIRGFRMTILDDALWRELLFLVFHADQAAVEAVPEGGPRPTPVYRRDNP